MKELVLIFVLLALAAAMVMAWRSPQRFAQWRKALGLVDGPFDKAMADVVSETAPDLERRVQQLETENQAMKVRLAALETIVTDSGFELDQQIRKLG
ncbi:hypothetical protein [Ferrimonas pelagia]|uniref:Uncharacterized protein n=1 Tax=Ferrimonas pelagia TaxID=1177826 RepID=A0ABP9EMY7_9GAMM